MYFPKTPLLAKKIFPKLMWDNKSNTKTVYLTFDDGPTPKVTNWVLEQLNLFDAKATFFCLGKNVALFPEIFERLLKEGHSVGNHTYNHLNAWRTTKEKYLNDVSNCEKVFHSKLFRPPYGKLKPGIRTTILKNYKIIMWDIMSYDFDATITPIQCISNVVDYVRSGSIIVFHDSLKAEKNLKESLPIVLKYLTDNGMKMHSL